MVIDSAAKKMQKNLAIAFTGTKPQLIAKISARSEDNVLDSSESSLSSNQSNKSQPMNMVQSHAAKTPLEFANDMREKSQSTDSNAADDFYERKANFKAKVRLNKKDPLLCSDIIFQMINDSLKCIEPVIYGFAREADILLSLVEDVNMTNMNNRRSML